MDIHPGLARFAVALHHAQKLPAVPLIEARVVRDEVNRGDPPGSYILHRHIEQTAGDAPAPVALFRVDRADVGGKVLPVVEVVFDHAQAADDLPAVQAEVPAVFGFAPDTKTC